MSIFYNNSLITLLANKITSINKYSFYQIMFVTTATVAMWSIGLFFSTRPMLRQGQERGMFLLLVMCVIPWLVFLASKRSYKQVPINWHYILSVAIIIVAIFHGSILYKALQKPYVIDIGVITAISGRAIASGQNPYQIPMSREKATTTDKLNFDGFKYLPVMAIIYLPLVLIWGLRGILLTNAVLNIFLALILYLIGKKFISREAGLFSSFLYLLAPIIPHELFNIGSTDIAAVVTLLAAFYLMNSKPFLSGLLVGLSLTTKLFPGLICLVLIITKKSWRQYFFGILLGQFPIIPFLVWSPRDLITNGYLWGTVARQVNKTSWQYGLSPYIGLFTKLIFIGSYLFATFINWFKPLTLQTRLGIITFLIIIAILSGSGIHGNYHIWWIPWLTLLISATIFPSPLQAHKITHSQLR